MDVFFTLLLLALVVGSVLVMLQSAGILRYDRF